MASAASNEAENFLVHQEARRTHVRCGELTSWSLGDNIESTVQLMVAFEGPEGSRRAYIPDDPYILRMFMHQLHERVLEQCKGSA